MIVAGSTGSRGATRPSWRRWRGCRRARWCCPASTRPAGGGLGAARRRTTAGAADHPQHGFRRLADALGFDPAAVPAWHPAAAAGAGAQRARLAGAAAGPGDRPVARARARRSPAASPRPAAGSTWVEAPDPRTEAQAIALALREAAETGRARRAGHPRPHAGAPGDGRARPLGPDPRRQRRPAAGADPARRAAAPARRAARRAADAAGPARPARSTRWSRSAPGARAAHLRPDGAARTAAPARRRALDRLGRRSRAGPRRGGRGAPGLDRLAARGARAARRGCGRAPLADPRRAHTAPPPRRWRPGRRARPATGSGRRRRAGRRARCCDALAAEADAGGAAAPGGVPRAARSRCMAARDVPEEAVVTHPGIAIWGTLEARVQSADLVILGGLNEGVWPRLPGPDPWLSRAHAPRRSACRAPSSPIGLSAHDFQQAMGAAAGRPHPRRPRRRGADRRLALAAAAREPAARPRDRRAPRRSPPPGSRGAALVARAALLDRPAAPVPPAPRPAPRPPAAARPAELSVTADRDAGPRPLRDLRPQGPRPEARSTRPGARPTRWRAAARSTPPSTPSSPPPPTTCRRTRARSSRATVRDVLAEAAPVAGGAGDLDRAARPRRRLVPRRRGRAPRPRAAPSRARCAASAPLDGLALPFAVTAKADRIDRAADGSYAIYDYKSGGVPSRRRGARLPPAAAARRRRSPRRGGFDGAARRPRASTWSCSGSARARRSPTTTRARHGGARPGRGSPT